MNHNPPPEPALPHIRRSTPLPSSPSHGCHPKLGGCHPNIVRRDVQRQHALRPVRCCERVRKRQRSQKLDRIREVSFLTRIINFSSVIFPSHPLNCCPACLHDKGAEDGPHCRAPTPKKLGVIGNHGQKCNWIAYLVSLNSGAHDNFFSSVIFPSHPPISCLARLHDKGAEDGPFCSAPPQKI